MGLLRWLFYGRAEPEGSATAEGGGHVEDCDASATSATDEYEIYDLFDTATGDRIPAQRRVWHESLHEVEERGHTTTRQSRGKGVGGSQEAPSSAATTACSRASGAFADDSLQDKAACARAPPPAPPASVEDPGEAPWVVLTAPEPRAPARPAGGKARLPPPGKAAGKGGKGKGPPPPPFPGKAQPKSKGPAMPPPGSRPKGFGGGPAVPKKAAAPPPFGKRLHWKLLPPKAVEDTIFEELRPWSDGGGAQPLDTRQFERLFAPPPGRNDRANSLTGAGEAASSGSGSRRSGAGALGATSSDGNRGERGSGNGGRVSRAQVCLLDAKRAQNLAIVLRQVPVKCEELAEALRLMKVKSNITPETLEHVYDNLLPHLLESTDLLNYDGPPEALRDVERQLLPLARLARLKARVRAMLFNKSMPSMHMNLMGRIRSLSDATSQVRGSSAFRMVLSTVLRVGNYLNHGVDAPDASGSGEVRGFTMESLLKFRDFRAGAVTGEAAASALHCVALHLISAEPQLLARLKAELKTCLLSGAGSAREATQGGDTNALSSSTCVLNAGIADLRDAVGRFRSEIDLVQNEIDRFPDCYSSGEGGFFQDSNGPLTVLKRTVEDARGMSQRLEAALEDALTLAKRLLEYFGERDSMTNNRGEEALDNVEKFFAVINEFVASFEECWRDVVEQPRKFRLEAAVVQAGPARGGSPPNSKEAGGGSGVGGGSAGSRWREAREAAAAAAAAAREREAGRDAIDASSSQTTPSPSPRPGKPGVVLTRGRADTSPTPLPTSSSVAISRPMAALAVSSMVSAPPTYSAPASVATTMKRRPQSPPSASENALEAQREPSQPFTMSISYGPAAVLAAKDSASQGQAAGQGIEGTVAGASAPPAVSKRDDVEEQVKQRCAFVAAEAAVAARQFRTLRSRGGIPGRLVDTSTIAVE
eukprot:TRINITY_DN8524_c0_g1_i2.p1 TRINITY_DN8524_c0_g1~~TRINITY_DN8524_c0_g1_i2.p1  ORF type:complete len:933 (+),score=225.65 TRINITY_DN8524_c0_g1_i2:100-2898(+)